MASRFTKPSVNKNEYTHPPVMSPASFFNNIVPRSSHATPPPPYSDHILSIPAADAMYSSATARQEAVHRRRPMKWLATDDDGLPHDKFYKAEHQRLQAKQQSRNRDWRISMALFVWALFIRFWHIWEPASVVFDEVHFGGFASKYIRTRFFMDVHPPLAKMLIALVAKLAGFDGHFNFKDIGDDYIEPGVPYITMRSFCALNGALVVPLAYWTIRGCGHSVSAAIVAALMVCYDNGLIANNRLILLDPPLLFFTAATTLAWVNFQNQDQKPFRFWWWTWLMTTGLGLGFTLSCKWVGLFIIATVGVSTIHGLWVLLGDPYVTWHRFSRHFAARALCLIVMPLTVYALMFAIHFHCLPNSGEGDGFMSAEFQQTLAGHSMKDTPIDIAYGSKVYIRHIATRGGYLHSHPHNYPWGSKQQQVTLYPHQDSNNWWTLYKDNTEKVDEIEYIRHGDIVRLKHDDTGKRLHTHNHRPPMSELDYHSEVSAYGFPDFEGDANDLWRVEIMDHDKHDPVSKDRLRTLHSKFRLVHMNEGCVLFSHNVKLPDWGYGQQEVTCMRNSKPPKTMWYVESTTHELLPPNAEKVNYRKPGFWAKFKELNAVMWDTNQGLTQSHPYDSRPQDWPFLRRGISFWGKDFRHVYLLGNPFVYWSTTLAIIFYFATKLALLFVDKRGYKTDFRGELK
ncbi:PMT-domain-containing protein [Hesseltinella vesiculosa]|uniref:Dolichyl-phosphate-mannose--protein mannosyltransferase n=1 Tax=Hesseltinella vesiculosa TaxID=101127 RepID=A0A1X2GIL5_9FUNG|nr:PMT-domain-containing protein [Hesseltinella vesiculosa]